MLPSHTSIPYSKTRLVCKRKKHEPSVLLRKSAENEREARGTISVIPKAVLVLLTIAIVPVNYGVQEMRFLLFL